LNNSKTSHILLYYTLYSSVGKDLTTWWWPSEGSRNM